MKPSVKYCAGLKALLCVLQQTAPARPVDSAPVDYSMEGINYSLRGFYSSGGGGGGGNN